MFIAIAYLSSALASKLTGRKNYSIFNNITSYPCFIVGGLVAIAALGAENVRKGW